MGKNFGFQIKLSVVTIAIVLVTVLCTSLSQMFMTRNDVLRQGRDGLSSISSTLAESVPLQHALMQKKIIIDRNIMKTQFELSGFPVPEVLMDAELDLVNQDGGTGRHDQGDISDNVNQAAWGSAEINSNVTSSSVMTREISV